jgi:outer membrane lipoprotein carrier protein
MKTTILSLTFLALIVSPVVSAQKSELDQLVLALQSKYNKLRSMAADFTQVYSAPGERTRRESGRLLLKKPGRMRWDYTAPESKLFVSNGRVIYEYLPADKYATKSSVKESDDLRAPFMFLLGRGNLRRDFKLIEFARESPVNAGNKVLKLVPKRTQDFDELMIEVEPLTLRIARLSFIDSDQGRSDFIFSNINENVPASASQFSFKAPPGVEVREID